MVCFCDFIYTAIEIFLKHAEKFSHMSLLFMELDLLCHLVVAIFRTAATGLFSPELVY